jgi:hypothetical protein
MGYGPSFIAIDAEDVSGFRLLRIPEQAKDRAERQRHE